MTDDFEEHFRRFFKSNNDLESLLNKLDDGKIAGNYFASKAVKDGVPGYILRIKLFVPEAVKAIRRGRTPVKLEEVWVMNGQARVLITTPPDLVSVDSLRYDGSWLRLKTKNGKEFAFFLGLPLLWRGLRTTYSNGVLQIVAPLRLSVYSRMKLSKAATKASNV
ncbi:MAG TPA: hypothetical protein VEG31_02985 [Thermoproteota archaeon]|nr:hypothetical protein [Thermoproteota archaeon]